jgi:hypothetical protein
VMAARPRLSSRIEVLARSSVRKTDFEASCVLDAFRAVRDDTNSFDHIHDLRNVTTRRCSSPINWRVRQSASHHFSPQVFSSLPNKRVIGRSICVGSISLNLLFDVFIKHRDAVVGQRLQAHCSNSSRISAELGSLNSAQAPFWAYERGFCLLLTKGVLQTR